VPPVADIGLEYAVLAVPAGSEAEIVNPAGAGAATIIDRGANLLCTGLPASVTDTVKPDVPLAVGLPEIRPVDVFRLSPAGSCPEAMLQVYGVVPPVACKTWE
jgi:hypothetical protein